MKAVVTLRHIRYDADLYHSNTIGWIDAGGKVEFVGLAVPSSLLRFEGHWYDDGANVGHHDDVICSTVTELALPIHYHRQLVARLGKALWLEAEELDGFYPQEKLLQQRGFRRDPEMHSSFVWHGQRTIEIELH